MSIHTTFTIDFDPEERSGSVHMTINSEPGEWLLSFISVEGMSQAFVDLYFKALAVMMSATK